MRIPGTTGHQQHRFVLEFSQRVGDMQGVGHHHQARLLAEFRDHRGGGTAAVDDDARMLANPRDGGAGNGLLVFGNRLADVGDQLLRHGDRAAITTQQQTVAFKRRQVLANRNFRGFEAFGQLVHTDFALLIEQGEDIVAALGRVAL